ncbi:MAG: sigma-70 family RNA polymerase sigma factor [Candidatus Gracilibacteria bacterium]|jgi:RNA polymerase sigma-70 factor (ECF subfamily)
MAEKDLKEREIEIEELVIEAQNGQTEAFAKLYDFFVQPVYRYIYFRVNKEDALDLTEGVFLKIWERMKGYKKSPDSAFSAWVFRIAHNMVVDHYRMNKESFPLDESLRDNKRESDPVYVTERKLSRDRLKLAISKLKKKYQQILLLKYVSELQNDEIAKIMNKSEGSLRILKMRALQALKKVLEDMNIHS